ncbi:MAG: putative C-S lyase [Firmicutes bacterium]|nr:putative C-S lyase [Bacillota bacterium]
MKYDFDRVIDRKNTDSIKWDRNSLLFGTEDILDMWVADMDFPCPQPVVEAIKKRAANPVYGYTFPAESLYEAIIERLKGYYGWEIKKEWIIFTAGVVNGIYSAVKAFTRPGDEVILQPPVYYPFYSAIKNTGCQVLHNQLKFMDNYYTMDYEGLKELFSPLTTFPARTPVIKLLMLCSPHNPVGRVWTAKELSKLADICLDNNCIILSDEIHCDLIYGGAKHTVTATLSKEVEQHTITFVSASKTFNLAGLATSIVIIPNDSLRAQYLQARAGHNSGNTFGYVATEAAFRHGEEYLQQLCHYLSGNLDYFINFINTKIPRLRVIKPEGTYLVWVDMRNLGLDTFDLQRLIRAKARLALDDGYAFGPGGEGFQRFNLACPRSLLEEALTRLEKAVKEL